MGKLKNLSVIRKIVQLALFIFLVYGSVIVGYYTADKISGAFPALACAYDQKTADYCALIVFEHGVGHRIGAAIASGAPLMAAALPVAATLGVFLLLFVLLNKAFCGWVCPMGFFQEALTLFGQKLGLKTRESIGAGAAAKLRPVKWLMLAFLVFIFPLLAGAGYISHDLGDPFCKICPSRIMTTLAAGDKSQLYFDSSSPAFMTLSVIGNFMFGLILAVGLTVRQPFCRICPMLALHAAFMKLGLARLVKDYKGSCDKCGLCAKACPMGIAEIHTSTGKNALFADCTLCGRCVEFCPRDGELAIKYGPFALFKSSLDYAKNRTRAQREWENAGWLDWRKSKGAPAAES